MKKNWKDTDVDRMVAKLYHMGIGCNNYILHKNTYKKQITEKIE